MRRASTTVELRDGQSFAIAGLLQSISTADQKQLPWLADVPVLGALVRSASYQKKETDLVIIVTPRLVRPARPGDVLRTPLDGTQPANDADFFLLGQAEVTVPMDAADQGRSDGRAAGRSHPRLCQGRHQCHEVAFRAARSRRLPRARCSAPAPTCTSTAAIPSSFAAGDAVAINKVDAHGRSVAAAPATATSPSTASAGGGGGALPHQQGHAAGSGTGNDLVQVTITSRC